MFGPAGFLLAQRVPGLSRFGKTLLVVKAKVRTFWGPSSHSMGSLRFEKSAHGTFLALRVARPGDADAQEPSRVPRGKRGGFPQRKAMFSGGFGWKIPKSGQTRGTLTERRMRLGEKQEKQEVVEASVLPAWKVHAWGAQLLGS